MTSPRGGTIGDAFIAVHADTRPFSAEVDRDLERVAKDSEQALERTGDKFGDKITDSASARIRKRGKDFGRAIERGTRNVVVQVRSLFRFDSIRDAIRRRFRRDVGDSITDEVGKAFDRAGRRGGPISKLGQAFADAVGAGFNVSGRSPLIAVLLPALAALVGVILAALQAVNALVAVLYIIPGLIASIGLQVGVLVIAFQGMGEAIQGAFQAKNAKELRLALQGLTPSAKSFVKELLKLKPLFAEIKSVVQERFFNQIAGVITGIRKALGPSLVKGFGDVAAAFGMFFRRFGELIASPTFVKFFNVLVPATVRWIDKLGVGLFAKRGFITSLLNMATVLMPFMEKFGDIIINNLSRLSGLIFQLGTNPTTQKWLDDMAVTLQLVFDLLFKVGEFLFVFLARLNEAGGNALFDALLEALSQLMFFLSSPVGLKGMEGLINLGIIGIKVFTGLIELVFLALAAVQKFSEWLKDTAVPAIIADIRTLGSAIVAGATWLGTWIERIARNVNNWLFNVRGFFRGLAESIFGWAARIIVRIKEVYDRLRSIPGGITGIFRGFGSLLVNAGRALIQGLINGVWERARSLWDALSRIASRVAGFFGSSPAKEGALSGRGWTLYRGQRLMQDLIKGIQMEVPDLRKTTMNATSNIIFGRDSIRMEFRGNNLIPDKAEAMKMGTNFGVSAATLIASRNTRLAVRTL